MSAGAGVLRIRICLSAAPLRCEWALVDTGRETLSGMGLLTELPRHAGRVEVVLPASDVLLTRRALPGTARGHGSALLAYAVEDVTAADPENNQVSWLGSDEAGVNALAVLDRSGLLRWRTALAAVGIHDFELSCETLLLPWTPGTWSLAWNGTEGFVRTGAAEGCATDCGDRNAPSLSLQLLLEAARTTHTVPASITIYTSNPAARPDMAAWTRALGVPLQSGGNWHWSMVAPGAGPGLGQQRQRWQLFNGLGLRLRPALWMLGLALAVHAAALAVDLTVLAAEQRNLRVQMEARFRALFPDAVAVVDPVLQLRRQLASARQNAGYTDSGDFLPLLELVAQATIDVPAGTLRTVSFERGRLTLEFAGADASAVQLLLVRLRESGLVADAEPSAADSTAVVLNVRTA